MATRPLSLAASSYGLATTLPSLVVSVQSRDRETTQENILFITQCALDLLHSNANFITSVSSLSTRLLSCAIADSRPVLTSFAAGMVGFVGCLVDAAVEIRGAYRCTQFLNEHFSSKGDLFIKAQAWKEEFVDLPEDRREIIAQRALANHPYDLIERAAFTQLWTERAISRKQQALIRVVGKTFTQGLTEKLKSPPTEPCQLEKLFEEIEIQAQKMRLIHIVGLIGALIVTLSFIIGLFIACPLILPLIIGIIGTLFYIARYLLASELLEVAGKRDLTELTFWKSAVYKGFAAPLVEFIQWCKAGSGTSS
jgi:hypothetical protein